MVSPRENMIRVFCIEEPSFVPFFEPYGLASPTFDTIMGRPALDNKTTWDLLQKGKLKKVLNRNIRDKVELVKRLKSPAVLLRSNAKISEFIPPIRIGENEWKSGASIFRYHPSSNESWTYDKVSQRGIEGLKERIENLREEKDSVSLEEFYVFESVLKRLKRERLDVFVFSGMVEFDWHVCGWTAQALKWMYTNPDLLIDYLTAYNDLMIEYGKMQIDLGADGILDGGDIADKHGPMISSRHYRKFILPFTKRHVDVFHKKGAFVVNRSDGYLWPILDDFLINSGVDGYHEIDKSAGMDLGELKEAYGDKICFFGNVDCGNTLQRGSVEDVIKETKDCIRKASPGGGHVLCSSNGISICVKPENFLTMVKTGRKYGKYTTI